MFFVLSIVVIDVVVGGGGDNVVVVVVLNPPFTPKIEITSHGNESTQYFKSSLTISWGTESR